MKCLINESTEERIKSAAVKVFMEKGYDGTTTRDIAREAGLNSALMNYYFRSKEKLFACVFADMCHLFFQGLAEILNKPMSLKEKIMEMIDHDYTMFKKHPALSNFILNELHRSPERLLLTTGQKTLLHKPIFEKQLKEAIKAGEIKNVGVEHILLLIPSNIQFIFLSKPMQTQLYGLTEQQFDKFADKHLQVVKEMISNYLFHSV